MLANIERRLEDVHADLFGVGTAGQSSPPLIEEHCACWPFNHPSEGTTAASGACWTPLFCIPPSRTAVSQLSSLSLQKWLKRQIQIVNQTKKGSSVRTLATLDLTLMKLHRGPSFGTPTNTALQGETVFHGYREGPRGSL